MIKNNVGLIVKLYVNHIALAIYGLLMAIIGMFIGAKNGNTQAFTYIFGAIAVVLYLCILYVNFWELGAKDKIKIDGGRMKFGAFNGLLISLVANVPTVLFGLLGFVSRLVPSSEALEVCRIIYHYYNGTYISFLGALSDVFIPIYILTIIPGLLVSFGSYILGAKGYKCIFPEPKKQQEQHTK